MLILCRKSGQTICIYPEDQFENKEVFIEIKVLNAWKGLVRLGIQAPSNMTVHREEIYQRILTERDLTI